MQNQINYIFFKYDPSRIGLLNCALIGKRGVYSGFHDKIECYSQVNRHRRVIAVFKLKTLNK